MLPTGHMKNISCILIFVVLVASLGAVYHKTGGYQLPGTLCNDVDVEGDRVTVRKGDDIVTTKKES